MQVQHTSFRLGLPDLHVSRVAESTDGTLLVWVEGVAAGAECSECGSWTQRVHQRRKQPVGDLPAHGHPVVLVLTRRRWRCGHCDHVFAELLPSASRYQRMTVRLQEALYQVLRERPVTAVAEDCGLGPGRL